MEVTYSPDPLLSIDDMCQNRCQSTDKTGGRICFSSPQTRIKIKHFERRAGDYDFGNTHASSL